KSRRKRPEIFSKTLRRPGACSFMCYAGGAVPVNDNRPHHTGVVLDSRRTASPTLCDLRGLAPCSTRHADRTLRGRDCHSLSAAAAAQGGSLFFTLSLRAGNCTHKSRRNLIRNGSACYSLPDGRLNWRSYAAAFRAPELLFRPELVGEEWEGIHEVLAYSIQRSDMGFETACCTPILLCRRSTTLFRGFGDRLLAELKRLVPKDNRLKISAPQERLYSTWIGGSILAALDTFRRMWVSKKEYDEEGARSIHRKTF
uniref:Actin n=1 Tax=Macrostomum lignano TaxID=282301 RepID=A0A1I8FBL7_9PLAT